jgi:hypothetical protein
MPSTGRCDLLANRWEPLVRTFAFEDRDFTGASFIAQVRLTRDAAGSALISLATVGSVGTEGIAIVGVETDSDGVDTTTILMRINEATMEALPAAGEVGEDVTLYWDMQITPSGGSKYRALEGEFVVHAGVTH